MAYANEKKLGLSEKQAEKLLQDIRAEYTADCADWNQIRTEGDICVQYSTGNTWDAQDEVTRKGRLMMRMDESGQYTNQVINETRQNKRSIQVTGTAYGSMAVQTQAELDKLARFRQERIRQIEWLSNAQQAYTALIENAVLRGFGWLRVTREYVSDDSFEQEIRIRSMPNPNLVTPGPHIMPDGSDLRRIWYEETRTHVEFEREFPKAEIRSFPFDTQTASNGWIRDTDLRIAEYWTTIVKRRELLLVQHKGQQIQVFTDELPKRVDPDKVLKRRDVDAKQVCQYLTNGVEILSKTEWPEPDIPFVPCYGPVYFVASGGKTQREIHSMLRKARHPLKFLNWLWSKEGELIQRAPNIPYFVRKGSLSPESWDALMRSDAEPVVGIEVEAMLPEGGNNQPPEFPHREEYHPYIQELEYAKESVRRAVQSAMAVSPLPVAAQKDSQKSGVFVDKLRETSAVGSYHFYDNQQNAIMRTGLLVSNLLKHIDDGQKDVTIRDQADKARTVRINDPEWIDPQTGKPNHIQAAEGHYDVTISTGPKIDSERQQASEFADNLLGSPQLAQVLGPEKYSEILALGVKLKNVGPLGDEIAEIINPSEQQGEDDPKRLKMQVQQLQQASEVMAKELKKRTDDANLETAKLEAEHKLQIELQTMKSATAIDIAHINATAKGLQLQAEHEAELEKMALGAAVDVRQADEGRRFDAQQGERAHEQGLEAGDAQHQQALQQAMLGHAAAMEQGQAGHEQALEQGVQGHEQNLEAGAQAAALAPQPEASA